MTHPNSEGPSEKKIMAVGITSAAVILVLVTVALIASTTTGKADEGAAKAAQAKGKCERSAHKTVSLKGGDVVVEDLGTLVSYFEATSEECSDTAVYVRLKDAAPTDFAAMSYDARDITKDGSQCTWTDSGGDLHHDECTTIRVGEGSEVRELLVEKVRDQLRYPDNWDGKMDERLADPIESILIGDRPCAGCEPVKREGR